MNWLRNYLFASTFLTMIFSTTQVFAQNVSDKMMCKALERVIDRKSPKEIKQNAKILKKGGWYVLDKSLPIDRQLDKTQIKEFEEDRNGCQKWIVSAGRSIAGSRTNAKLQAIALAKRNLASQVLVALGSIIEINDSIQLTTKEAAVISEVLKASQTVVAEVFERVIMLTEMYKEDNQNDIEARIKIAYNQEAAISLVKVLVTQELVEKTAIERGRLVKIMNF